MTTVSSGGVAVASGPVLDWIVTLNSTPVLQWAPVVLFVAGLLWLAYLTSPRRTETLNERSEREVEEGRR